MSQNLQLALLIIVIIALYVISSRWRPEDQGQRGTSISYRIGLVVVLLLAVLYAIFRTKHG